MKENNTVNQYKFDLLKWSAVLLLTIGAFSADYFTNFSTPIKMIGWIAWFLVSAGIIVMTARGNGWLEFAKSANQELRKVVWPTRHETVQMTLIIMVVVFIVSLLLWAIDASLLWLVAKLTKLG